MKTNVVCVLVIMILFSSCHGRSRNAQVTEDSPVKIQVVDTIPSIEISPDSLFYKEMFNKDGLVFSSWKDSSIIANVGESEETYSLPVLIQRGETTTYYFYFQTTNEKWSDSEDQGFSIYYKPKVLPGEGKTLAEDQVNKHLADWRYLSQEYKDKLNSLLDEKIKYPTKQFVHK